MHEDPAIQNLQDKVDLLNQQAWDLRVHDSPKAFELSKESVAISGKISYAKGLAEGLRSLGFSYVRIAQNQEALPLLEEALRLFVSLDDLKGQAVIYGYLAIIQRNWGNFGAALELTFKSLELSERTDFKENVATDLYQIGVTYKYLGNFNKALEFLYKSLSIFRELEARILLSYPLNVIGSTYFENGDYTQALEYYGEALQIREESKDKLGEAGSLDNIGYTWFKLQDFEQAVDYCKRSLVISEQTGDKKSQANSMQHLAEIYKQAGDELQATSFSNQSLEIRKQIGDKRGEVEILLFLVSLNKDQPGKSRDVGEWLTEAIHLAEEIKGLDLLSNARFARYNYYKQEGKYREAIEELEKHMQLEGELHRNAITQKMQNLEISHKAEQATKEAEAIALRNRELTELNQEIREQKEKLESTLADLKATQAQLVHAEKMASLGELTAGIAHEIQNPLNFVNNFSEVNNELIEEVKSQKSKLKSEELDDLLNDIYQNNEKISHHGKRADAIVKNMQQHSRSSSGQKEPADINALCDEYLRLAYHGLRAKDKSFNATLKTDFDNSIGMIHVVPQDIGRVLLNLINNAFYAVNERGKLMAKSQDLTASSFTPAVSINTKKTGNKVEIKVADNGNGISKKVLDKIFQPFFTTKPTGEGTGLGLSLSYDIITKGHGGELVVETSEGEGSTFIIQLKGI